MVKNLSRSKRLVSKPVEELHQMLVVHQSGMVRKPARVIVKTGSRRADPGEKGGAGRPAERRTGMGVEKRNAFRSQPIHIRRQGASVPLGKTGPVVQVVE